MRSSLQNCPILAAAFCSFVLGLAVAPAHATQLGDIFYISMENHNWTQPPGESPGQIFQSPYAPYINSLVTPGNPNSAQVSYATAYHNVLATPSGNNPSIHPSEPNYIWSEAGSNLGVLNDNDPYGSGGTNQNTQAHLTSYLNAAGISWKSYQEDVDVNLANNTALPKSQWYSPVNSFSGTFTSGPNAYNGSNQYNYAAKHNPQIFFGDTNGGPNATSSNPAAQYYAPLQQLSTDLANNTVARYNWISPNQYNDMHSTLTGGFNYQGQHLTGDAAAIAQGDNFLSIVVPQIEASQAFQNNGAIVLWWDESENGDDFAHTIGEIVISPLAKGNAYASSVDYTHSSDLLTLQEIFNVGGCLRDACNATDLSDLFQPGTIPTSITRNVPEPGSMTLLVAGLLGLGTTFRRRRG